MKKIVALLVSSIVAFAMLLALSSRLMAQPILQKSDTSSIAGNWVLVPILPSDTITGKIPYINFDLVGKRFTGFTGCNAMSGRFLLLGYKISFKQQLISTKAICQGYNEKQFTTNLLRVTDYKIQNGILILMYGSIPLSKWMRKTGNITL